jgi:outer membrane protein TolC
MKVGLALPAERDRLEAERQAARQQRVHAQEEISDLDARWRYLVPEYEAPDLHSLGGLSSAEPVSAPPETAIHAYAVNRPDVLAAHALWQAAGEGARGAARNRLPTVSAIVTAEGEGPSPVDEPEAWTAWAGVRLSLPVLAPGRSAQVNIRREEAHIQEALFEETVALAIRDIRQAYARRLHAEQAWRAAQVSADRLRESFESFKRQFEQGRVPVPTVERAKLDWLASEEAMRVRYAEVLLRQVDLVRACGGPTDTALHSGN